MKRIIKLGLKDAHPQKYYLKIICSALYYFGYGDCWYEKTHQSKTHKYLYFIWSLISNFYVVIIVFNEYLANFRTDLTEKEQNDLIQFNIAHTTILAKIVAYYAKKEQIRYLLKRFLEDTRHVFSSTELDKASVRKFVRYCGALVGVSYVTLSAASIDGYRAHLNEGIPMRTEVTYYPTKNQTGFLANTFRFFVEFHWYYLVGVMSTIDCITVCCLVFLGYKFELLQLFFGNMRKKLEMPGDLNEMEKEFQNDFIVGIKLHEDALWCARNVQKTLGIFYSIQIFESVTLLVMCLIKVVSSERHIAYLLANLMYITCLIVITGCYMMPAGDITHEASLLSTCIFHCGWELTKCRKNFRVLAVVALQRSQKPVMMTAFGILILSYSNLITVLRSSYSFFAVMY